MALSRRAPSGGHKTKCPRPTFERTGHGLIGAWPLLNALLPAWSASIVSGRRKGTWMAAIGIDTHKATLAVCAIDDVGAPTSERTFANDAAGHADLAAWAAEAALGYLIGVEGSSSFGAPVARFLVGRGFEVREVPPQLSRRERIRTRRAGKSDPGDAIAIARVAAREVDLPPVRMPGKTADLALLVEAREDVVAEMTRVRNRVHADLRILIPGYSE